MWLSKMISKTNSNNIAESGNVTIASADSIEANATVNCRNLPTYSPYGYTSVAPVGEEIMLIPSTNGQVAVGTRSSALELESGEICISSKGGAKIILKNDGSVIINSVVISKNGVINS
ncbi:MAG: hypothetical protein ACI4IG_06900 [Eubacterium sp.]